MMPLLHRPKPVQGIADILEALCHQIAGHRLVTSDAPLQALLLLDSWYDAYLGVMTLVRVRHGVLKKGMKIRMMATGATHVIERVGVFAPKPVALDQLWGRVKLALSMPGSNVLPMPRLATPSPKSAAQPTRPLPGFAPSVPVVFCGLFPVDTNDFSAACAKRLEKLSLE